jgi:hypothetical protein
MRGRLPGDDGAAAAREPLARVAVRLAIVAWLLAVEPAALALWLGRALPRLASLGAAAWALLILRVVLVAVGVAIGRRLFAVRDATIWRGVAAWAGAATAVVLAGRIWPLPFTDRAPSEARRDAAIAIAGYLVVAGLAWRRRHDAATPADSS